jgi:hypothetical protein
MVRRLALLGAVVALSASTLGVPSAHAAKPVDAAGTLDCALTGKVKISPKLTFGGNTPGGSLFHAKVKGTCTGSSGVTSVKGDLKARLPTNDCTALAAGSFPAATFGPVKYKGAGKYTKSNTSFTAGGTFTAANPITLNLPGAGTSSVSNGSFAGEQPTMTLVFDQTAEQLATGCGAKQKGVKGSGGLKKMTFGGASSFDIS